MRQGPILHVSSGLLVNDRRIPVETKVMAILDPYNLGGEFLEHLDQDAEQMTIVNLMSSGKMSWLEHVLKLPKWWWRKKSSNGQKHPLG